MNKVISKLMLFGLVAFGQTVSAAEVLGVGNFSHIVSDLGRSIDFYEKVLGLEMNTEPTPFEGNPAVMQLGNTPGAQASYTTFFIPNSDMGIELIQYKDISRHSIQTRFQDPGATVAQLQVQDIEGILARLEDSQGKIWTPGGEVVDVGPGSRIIFIQDPDGFFIELIESQPADDVVADNVYGGNFELIINDSEETVKFLREALGFEAQLGEGFDDNPTLSNTVNVLGGAFRRVSSSVPGTNVRMAFLEFKNTNRKPMLTRTQDPGTAILQLFVDDVAAMTEQMVAAGGTLITSGGGPADFGGGFQISLIRDPNNLFYELMPR